MSKQSRPDFKVFGRSRGVDSSGKAHWKQVGVAWNNTTKGGVGFIRIQLDFMPNDGELTIYPNDEAKTRTRFDAIAEEF